MSLKPLSLRRSLGLQIADLAVVLLGIFIAEVLSPHDLPFDQVRLIYWSLVPLVLIVFQSMGVYRVLHHRSLLHWWRQVVVAWIVVCGCFAGLIYATKSQDLFPRSIVLLWIGLCPVVFMASRLLVYRIIRARIRRGIGGQGVLLVGDHAACRRFAQHLANSANLGMRVLGICSDQGAQLSALGRANERVPWLGLMADLSRTIEEQRPDRVVLVTAMGSEQQGRLFAQVQTTLQHYPLIFDYAPEIAGGLTGPLQATDWAGRPLFTVTDAPLSYQARLFKWCEDKLVALLAIIIFSPVFVVASLLIKLSSPGPILFIQSRHGLHGREIRVLKFRTMRQPTAAAAAAAAQGRELSTSGRFLQASRDDDRITWIGKLLRKTSFDELPQFFNVLRGDMSVVGPRPHPIGLNYQFAKEVGQLMHRHLMKPGITGLAQISGARGETSTVAAMRRRVELDLRYIRTWSPWLDMKIILLTPFKGFINYEP